MGYIELYYSMYYFVLSIVFILLKMTVTRTDIVREKCECMLTNKHAYKDC